MHWPRRVFDIAYFLTALTFIGIGGERLLSGLGFLLVGLVVWIDLYLPGPRV